MDQEETPPAIDVDRPSAARMYDYFLGGSHNFAADRELARQILRIGPTTALVARRNRAFLRRAVRYLAGRGIRQFLDLGSGIPTAGNVHEIAQTAAPGAVVVYVDIDPVAVAHSRKLLAGVPGVTVLQEDLRRGAAILDTAAVRSLLDLSQPVALLLVAVLHFIPEEDDPAGMIAQFAARLAPGSALVISHITVETVTAETDAGVEAAQAVYARTTTSLTPRSPAAVARLFDGFRLVDPGLVWLNQWRPDSLDEAEDPELSTAHAGVGFLE